jgi:hypothetical protein
MDRLPVRDAPLPLGCSSHIFFAGQVLGQVVRPFIDREVVHQSK